MSLQNRGFLLLTGMLVVGLLLATAMPATAHTLSVPGGKAAPLQLPCVTSDGTSAQGTECEVLDRQPQPTETPARLVERATQRSEGPRSPVLGTVPGIGEVAAPVRRFRDGGHAYYLFGRGLHSCTYVGKCMDLFAPVGEPVYAFAGGRVVRKPYAGGSYGHYLEIVLPDKSRTLYAHLLKVVAPAGEVEAGELIGYVGCSGTSGESNGCETSEQHLHFEWSALEWQEGEYGQLPPHFNEWRGKPRKCYRGC